MELIQGMGNKNELAQMKRKIKYYDIVQIDKSISIRAIEFIESFKLSHGLQIPDAIIGATAVEYQIPLYTYNGLCCMKESYLVYSVIAKSY